ncbi:MAG: MliC family protein [Lautropia sp.]|nr:MliC family protein [Lautropia sp.]
MRAITILSAVAAAVVLSACANMKDMGLPGLGKKSVESADAVQYECDNRLKVGVVHKGTDQIVLMFNNGKNQAVTANIARAASGEYYVSDDKAVTWHEKQGSAVFTYPSRDYSSTGNMVETICEKKQ